MNMIDYSVNYNAVVYSPVGRRIEKMRLLPHHISQIFDAVGELHRHGIIHRDLSPNHFFEVNLISFSFLKIVVFCLK